MKLASHKVLDLSGGWSKDKGQAVDVGVDGSHCVVASGRAMDEGLRSADDKGEGEDQVVFIGKLEEKGWAGAMMGVLGILGPTGSARCVLAASSLGEMPTRIKSSGVGSGGFRDGDTLVAGNAFGTMFMEVRRLGLAMTTDVIDTMDNRRQPGVRDEQRELTMRMCSAGDEQFRRPDTGDSRGSSRMGCAAVGGIWRRRRDKVSRSRSRSYIDSGPSSRELRPRRERC
jgi:hypothetical protein